MWQTVCSLFVQLAFVECGFATSGDWAIVDTSGHNTVSYNAQKTLSTDPSLHLRLQLDGQVWETTLEKVAGVYSKDAMITVMQGSDIVNNVLASDIDTSTFANEDGSVVFSTLGGSSHPEVDGIVVNSSGVLHIHAKGGAPVEVSNEGNVLGVCGGTDLHEGHARRLVEQWANCYDGDSVRRAFSIGIAVGSGLFQRKFNNNHEAVAQWINSVVAEANVIYRPQLNIVLTVGHVVIQQGSQNAPTWDDPNCQLGISSQLDRFQDWEQPSKQGLWHLFDDCFGGSGTVGLATMLVSDVPGTLCMGQNSWNNEYWNTAVSWYSSNTWKTFAHEIGHNFGGHHSFEEGQGRTGGIMDYGDGKLNGEYQFNTQYRKTQICASIQKVIGTCSAFSELNSGTTLTTSLVSGITSTTRIAQPTTTTTTVGSNPCGSSCQDSLGVTSTMTFNGVRYTDCVSLITAADRFGAGTWCSQFEVRSAVCQKTCGVCNADCPTSTTVAATSTLASTTTRATTTMTTTATTTTTTTTTRSSAATTTAPTDVASIMSGDIVFLRTRSGNGKYVDAEGGTVQARWESQGNLQAMAIEKTNGGTIQSGDTVYLRTHDGVHIDVTNEDVQARWLDYGNWQALTIEKLTGSGAVMPDDVVCFRAHTGNHLDVEDAVVRARWQDCGDWQRMRIEKEVTGALFSGDSIHLLAHTGKFIDVEGSAVSARWAEQGLWQTLVIENYGGRVIFSGDAVFVKAHTGHYLHVEDTAVHAMWNEWGDWQRLIIEKRDGSGPIFPGDTIFLRAHTGKMIEVDGEAVQCRWFDHGSWQSLVVEKSSSRRLTWASNGNSLEGLLLV